MPELLPTSVQHNCTTIMPDGDPFECMALDLAIKLGIFPNVVRKRCFWHILQLELTYLHKREEESRQNSAVEADRRMNTRANPNTFHAGSCGTSGGCKRYTPLGTRESLLSRSNHLAYELSSYRRFREIALIWSGS